MKRICSFVLALVMVLSLVGCATAPAVQEQSAQPKQQTQDTQAQQPAQSVAQPAATQTEQSPYAGKTLKVWVSKMFSDDVNKAVAERAQAFGQEYGVEVELEQISAGNITNVVNAAVEAGANVLPDVIMWSSHEKFMYYYPDLVTIPVTELYEKINAKHPYLGARKDGCLKIDGEYYGIPFYASCALLAIRKSAMNAAGYTEVPDTWDGLFDMADAMTKASGLYGLGWGCGPNDEDNENNSRTYFWSHGAFKLSKDGLNNSDLYKKFAERYVEMYKNGTVPVDATTWNASSNNNSYLIGESAMVLNASTLVRALKNDKPDLYEDTIFAACPPGADPHLRDGTSAWTITTGSKNPDLAAAFIEWMVDFDWYEGFIQSCVPVLTPIYQEVADSDFWQNDPINAANVKTATDMDVFLSYDSSDPTMMSVGMKLFQSYGWSNVLAAMCNGATFEEAWPVYEGVVKDIIDSSYGK